MKLLLRVDPRRTRSWTVRLVQSLATIPDVEVAIEERESGPPPETSVDLLIGLEKMLLHRGRPLAVDRIALAPVRAPEGAPDLVIDLTLSQPAEAVATYRVTYDGGWGEEALFAAVLAGHLPVIELVETCGTVRGRATPARENAPGFVGGVEATLARVSTLIVKVVREVAAGRRPPAIAPLDLRPAARPGTAAFALRQFAADLGKQLYRLCCHAPHWRIGWRLNAGEGLVGSGSLGGPAWNVLPDPGFRFFADPVPLVRGGRTFVFCEDLDHRHNKGVISALEFGPDGPIGSPQTVLEESTHLSYPFLIEEGGELYMIPESSCSREVVLYRCVELPGRWERAAVLLSGIEASDATIVRHGGRFWMFATTRDDAGGWSDSLSLFHAPALFGPWEPHPLNPVLIDAGAARPAGNMVRSGNRLLRPVQDCSRGYGSAIRIAEVTRLDPEGFEQQVGASIRPGPEWPGRKLHTINRAGPLEVIDGTVIRPKIPWLVPMADRLQRPIAGTTQSVDEEVSSADAAAAHAASRRSV